VCHRHLPFRGAHLDFDAMDAAGQWAVPPRRGRQVVVIEDEASISDPLRSALEREGYLVEVAATGAELVAQGRYEVVPGT